MPAAYEDDVFLECDSDLQDEVGTYTLSGSTYTWSQPTSLPATSTLPWTPRVPSSSNCVTYQSADLFPASDLGYQVSKDRFSSFRLLADPFAEQSSGAATASSAATTTASGSSAAATGASSSGSASSRSGSASTSATQTGTSSAASSSSSSTSGASSVFVSGGAFAVVLGAVAVML
jgi:cobalamin biosynthesis Mg chelatase CobN